MNKMLVAVFESENKAFEGLNALKDLDRKGDITLYASAVISKNDVGQVHVNTAADEGPIGTATGLFTGSLIGLIGGPVGMAVGAGLGALTGVAFDISSDDINVAFVDEVSKALVNGKSAVLAEIDETWTVPLDTRMEVLGGIVFRRLYYEVAEDQLQREAEALPSEYRDLQYELQQAAPADKARITSAINLAERKSKALNEQIRRKEDEAKKALDAKVAKIRDQMSRAGDKRYARLQERIDGLKADYIERMDRLKKASRRLHETFGIKEQVPQPA